IIPSTFDEDSDLLIAVRCIIRAWREMTYTEYKKDTDGKEDTRPTMNEFLCSFNLLYPLRRLNFLRAKIDQLYKLDQQALDTLRFYALDFAPADLKRYVSKKNDKANGGAEELTDEEQKAIRDALCEELRGIKIEINKTYLKLRRCGHDLKAIPEKAQAGGNDTEGSTNATPTGQAITLENLFYILGQKQDSARNGARDSVGDPFPTSLEPAPPKVAGESLTSQEEAVKRAKSLLEEDRHYDWVKGIADAVADGVKSARHDAHEDCKRCLNIGPEKEEASYASAIRAALRHYYTHYDDYDMLTFPILYNSGVGEASYVEVIRFSPDDATALIDEMNLTAGKDMKTEDNKKAEPFKCSKLAGEAFGHFGAFLNRQWRMNDILWGRLDGAERIIRTLLPDRPNEAAQLIGEAQAAIVCEIIAELCGVTEVSEIATHDFKPEEQKKLYRLLVEAFMHPRPRQKQEEGESIKVKEALSTALHSFVAALRSGAEGTKWKETLDKAIKDEDLFKYFNKHYAPGGGIFKRLGLFNTWRSVRTLGGIFGGISAHRPGGTLRLLVSLIAAPFLVPLVLLLRLRRAQATDKDGSESP
ncbi:MAG TPA: DUF3376 domain-containing protein, partial [Pyrinomonadaceae bacterium]